jgi:hypothetical protein
LRHVKARRQKAAGRGVLLYTKSSKR